MKQSNTNQPIEECLVSGKHKVWKFIHQQDYSYQTDMLKNRECNFKWLTISKEGTITVKGSHSRGYAWDGCTPKFNLLHITWGVFDGKLKKFETGNYKPYSYYASMVHDVLYQYKRCVPVSRKEADRIFLKMLQEANYMWASIYYVAVRMFGGLLGKWGNGKIN